MEQHLVSAARRKRRLGEPLTPEEDTALRQYFRERGRHVKVYIQDPEQERLLRSAFASEGGTSLSGWLLEKILHALAAAPTSQEEVDELREQLRQARDAEKGAREVIAALDAERKQAAQAHYEASSNYFKAKDRFATILETMHAQGGASTKDLEYWIERMRDGI